MYTKAPRPTDKKILPVEWDNISEELKVRPLANRAKQLSLLSAKELAELERPSASGSTLENKTAFSETASVRRPSRPWGEAVKGKVPGF